MNAKCIESPENKYKESGCKNVPDFPYFCNIITKSSGRWMLKY